ncbi:ribonuclease T2-like [Linnemannia zychae]|nr:ribonuclease T2-like [Linnemannia zychae]
MGLIVLVQQWFNGVGPSNAFTLHGLWPDTCAGGHGPPNGCDPRRTYYNVAARLKSFKGASPGFMNEMNTYWGSFKGDNNGFWSHEWSKHGTCISNLAPSCVQNFSPNQDVYGYFRQGLDLRGQYDLYKALANAGIMPGTTPDVEDMHEAIEKAFGVDAQINCEGGVLNEIWLYFNVKNGNQYVPTNAKYPGSCRGFIAYPDKNKGGGSRPPSRPPSPPPPKPRPTTRPTFTTTRAWPTRTTTTARATTIRRTPTGPAGPIRTGIQTGPCSQEGATVCVKPGVSRQFSKCNGGRWIVNECKAGKKCITDTGVLTHCG